ncbi:alpha/beta fold hydrolase [Neotamlana laminarinivorans]|uniref:Alpha/beta hydrolase n=1 Tax=Neotamlana laminarinivorans TaxID=2883124 RepID=A0A9X1I146_9FLAO|nr:alpha/beta hydrolase [Tamlana laminarinivorans]MCB4798648.1 alpha/beta hydrolase [Tamlana laminarinivorans]
MKKIIKKTLPKIIGTSLNTLSHIAPKYASTKAFDIFVTPRAGRLLDKHHDFLNTAIQEKLKYNDLDIHTYNWPGEGKTILLAHGWESNSYRWKVLKNKLQEYNYNIVALDAPAHGKSGGTKFNAILYSEFINVAVNHFKPSIIIGHSVGGMASIFFQHKYQYKNLEKLVLLGAPSEFTKIFKGYVKMLNFNSKIEDGLNQLVEDNFDNKGTYFSSANFTKKIEAEGLIIHDKHDKIVGYDEAKLIARHYKNSTLKTTEGFGHGLKDDSIDDAIINFINN